MSYNNLGNYYSTIFSLRQHHNYNIGEIEDLFPFEREIYLNMVLAYLQELREKTVKPDEKILSTFKSFGSTKG
jgi:hypothetical protein